MTETHTSAGSPGVLRLLDFCKGLAIAGIVLIHVVHRWFGWQGVHVFLVLSGFTLAYACSARPRALSWPRWYGRRALRLLPSYWVTALLGFLAVAALSAAHLDRTTIPEAAGRLGLDLVLARNFSHAGMFAYPNASLWYVPLIAGLYLVFPLLYAGSAKGSRAIVAMLLGTAALELAYRAFALYRLDGVPVAYGHGFLPLGTRPSFGLDRLAQDVPFQLWAPFGHFPSRIGEFAVGVAAAFWLAAGEARFTRVLLDWRTTLAGAAVWLLGNALLYVGLWGWIVADYLIAVGLTVALLGVARLAQAKARRLFARVSTLGVWSFYLFLTHLLLFYLFAFSYPLWKGSLIGTAVMLLLTLAGIAGACLLLRRVDAAVGSATSAGRRAGA